MLTEGQSREAALHSNSKTSDDKFGLYIMLEMTGFYIRLLFWAGNE